jgi:serine/threonine-protein kinase
VTCPHCRAQLDADARFCPACGKAAAPTESAQSWPAAGGAPDLIGREIAGRYRIVKKLGEGGMGAVYRGEQISLKRAVAVKVLKPELGSNQMILRRFNAEAEAVAKLSHPNTVNIYDFGQDTDGSLFIAMEFIEGRSLREAIQKEGPFSPTRAISIALQVAASLSDAHARSIVHRDLKPDNVMLQDRGRHKDVVRVLDFGIAKLRDDNRATQQAMTQAGDMLGTPQYMAPEQIRGEAIDGRTDIYALGCMIYEMVTGRMPYEAPTIMAMLSKHLIEQVVPPSQRRPDLALPRTVDELVLQAMAKDPKSRPPSMELFAEMLQTLLASLPADPNRSAGMSVQQGVATPAAPSSFQAPIVSPPPGAAFTPGGAAFAPGSAGFAPPQFPPPNTPPGSAPTPPPPQHPGYAAPMAAAPTYPIGHQFAPSSGNTPAVAGKSKLPIWIVLGVLALGGAGVGVWFAMQSSKTNGEPTQPVTEHGSGSAKDTWADDNDDNDDKDDKDDKDDNNDSPPLPPGEDPWAPQGNTTGPGRPKPAPVRRTIGTAATPIPDGAKLKVGSGYTSQITAQGHVHINATRGILIALAPLYGGTNDVDKLSQKWMSDTGVTETGRLKIFSAGKQRSAIGYIGQVAGAPVNQVIVLYIEPDYRLGVLYQAPTATFNDEAFQREVMGFFARGVVLP